MRGLSLVAASGGHSSSRCVGLSLSRPLLLWSTGSRHAGSVIVAHGPSCSAALCHQGSPSVIFLMASGNSSTASWSAEAAYPVILTFFKPNLFIKLSNHPLLALNSPALDPSPSFCFKSSYNDFAFLETY